MKNLHLLLIFIFTLHLIGISQNKVKKNTLQTSKDQGYLQSSPVVYPTKIKTAIDFGITPPLRDLPADAPMTEAEVLAKKQFFCSSG